MQIITQNKKAYFNYSIDAEFEAGVELKGSEVKSIRSNKIGIEGSYGEVIANEVFVNNMYIPEYSKTSFTKISEFRKRKLLLHRSQINKIIGKIQQKGYTLVILSVFLNDKNLIKIKIGIAKGKKLYDKRQTLKEKEASREEARIYKKSTL